nr:MAG TPA: hypothetical protein [Caudoviricetes sp.]
MSILCNSILMISSRHFWNSAMLDIMPYRSRKVFYTSKTGYQGI